MSHGPRATWTRDRSSPRRIPPNPAESLTAEHGFECKARDRRALDDTRRLRAVSPPPPSAASSARRGVAVCAWRAAAGSSVLSTEVGRDGAAARRMEGWRRRAEVPPSPPDGDARRFSGGVRPSRRAPRVTRRHASHTRSFEVVTRCHARIAAMSLSRGGRATCGGQGAPPPLLSFRAMSLFVGGGWSSSFFDDDARRRPPWLSSTTTRRAAATASRYCRRR